MEYERIAPMKNYRADDNTRKCQKCKKWLDLSQFSQRVIIPSPKKPGSINIPTLYYRSDCKICSVKMINIDKYNSSDARKNQHRKDPRKVMLVNARSRAKQKGLDFNIDYTDIIVPETCPLLGIPLKVSDNILGPNSPTIDRIICDKGYIKGNVMVISAKANTAKGNLTIEELELLLNNLKRVLYKEEELLES